MRIPSPRKLIEVAAAIIFALCVTVGLIVVTALLVMLALIEGIVDWAQAWRRRA